MTRTLIAGFGNVLRRDDGFGVEVVRRLSARHDGADGEITVLEVGTGGIHLAQELLSGYDRLIVVDAMTGGGAPGSIYVLELDDVEAAHQIDMHLTIPSRALSVGKALGALPPRVFMIGCEPADVDELSTELTPAVSDAVESAVREIRKLLGKPDFGAGVSGLERPQLEIPNPAPNE